MKILVTGSKGQLGSKFKNLNPSDHFEFIFTDRNSLDINDLDTLSDFFAVNKIDFILNCAAYTAVDLAEDEFDKACLLNSKAVQNLVIISSRYNVALIHFSTDYVFDGQNFRPYIEEDVTKPINKYGESKVMGELQILNSKISALIIRTSWLYDIQHKNFYNTMLRLGHSKSSISVVNDQVGTPTLAEDLAEATLIAIKNYKLWKNKREIYHFSNEGVASWYDFATAIFELNAVKCKVEPISCNNYPTKAKRPYYSILSKQKFKNHFDYKIRHWREALFSKKS